MKKLFLSIILSLALIPCVTFATEQVISLKDGSSIKGELVGINGGTYTLKTASMGEVKIEASKVANISDANWAANSTTAGGTSFQPATGEMNQKIENAQARIMNDPEAMETIKEMMADPELMNLLTDPSITQAAMAKDTQAIENNPKTKALMENPKIQAFIKKMESK
jgi:hypothetical protein